MAHVSFQGGPRAGLAFWHRRLARNRSIISRDRSRLLLMLRSKCSLLTANGPGIGRDTCNSEIEEHFIAVLMYANNANLPPAAKSVIDSLLRIVVFMNLPISHPPCSSSSLCSLPPEQSSLDKSRGAPIVCRGALRRSISRSRFAGVTARGAHLCCRSFRQERCSPVVASDDGSPAI